MEVPNSGEISICSWRGHDNEQVAFDFCGSHQEGNFGKPFPGCVFPAMDELVFLPTLRRVKSGEWL